MCFSDDTLFGDYSVPLGLEHQENPLTGKEELGFRPGSWLGNQWGMTKAVGPFMLRGGLLGRFGGPKLGGPGLK